MTNLLPIIYVSEGSLGDYIHQLSIIHQLFLKTGRKGILYITEKDTFFRMGVKYTFEDTYEIIINQDYIEEYKIYNNEPYDINLSIWRKRPDLFNNYSWDITFKIVYDVDWGSKPWLNIQSDNKWQNKILINVVRYRFSTNIDFQKVYNIYKDKLLFITNNIDDYHFFISKTGISIPVYFSDSFFDTCIAIRSCELYIGGLSGFLTIAHACHIPHIIGFSPNETETLRVNSFDKIFPNVKFNI